MERPEVRNEFGLDEYNETDVRKERAKRIMPWLLGALAIFAVLGVVIYAMSDRGTETAATASRPAATTGSGITMPAPGPAPQR